MDPIKQRAEIAKACKWHNIRMSDKTKASGFSGFYPLGNDLMGGPPMTMDCFDEVPDYPNDLDAMHEAEVQTGFNIIEGHALIGEYFMHLMRVVGGNEKGTWCAAICATAAQRAEAFLKVFEKWED